MTSFALKVTQRTVQSRQNAHKTLSETLNLPIQNCHTLSSRTFPNDSITGSLTFLEKKTSRYALATNPTRSDKPYPTPPRSANALETNALYLTALRLRRNAMYQLTCNSCDQQYIGSTTRFIHDRVKEHLNNENSSVKKRIYSCQNKDYRALRSRLLWAKTTPLIYAFMKHFTLESASLHSIPGRNVMNLQTFYFSILENIFKRF